MDCRYKDEKENTYRYQCVPQVVSYSVGYNTLDTQVWKITFWTAKNMRKSTLGLIIKVQIDGMIFPCYFFKKSYKINVFRQFYIQTKNAVLYMQLPHILIDRLSYIELLIWISFYQNKELFTEYQRNKKEKEELAKAIT